MWENIKKYMPWDLLEYTVIFSILQVINNLIYRDNPVTFSTMMAAAALYSVIQLRRDNKEKQ